MTLIRYTVGTVKNCESGGAPSGAAARFFWKKQVPRTNKLTLVAAKKPQLRKRARRDWSKAKASKFLSVLGETCNVSEACRRSGVPMTVAYRRRKMDAAFRAEWLQTIGEAYQRLELVLLDSAFNGTEKIITRKDGSEDPDARIFEPAGFGTAQDASRHGDRSEQRAAARRHRQDPRAARPQAPATEETG